MRELAARFHASPTIPFYPALFVGICILDAYLATVEPLQVLGRPVLVGLAAIALLQTFLAALTRHSQLGALIAASLFMAILSPLFWAVVCAICVFVALVRKGAGAERESRRGWKQFTLALNVFGLLLLAANLVQVKWSPADSRMTVAFAPDLDVHPPDIYLLMLDGYPRADTLASDFGYDNGPFLTSMERLGFSVAWDAHSNYNSTILTLVSMFNIRDARELVPTDVKPPKDFELLSQALNGASGLSELRNAGYEILTVPRATRNIHCEPHWVSWRPRGLGFKRPRWPLVGADGRRPRTRSAGCRRRPSGDARRSTRPPRPRWRARPHRPSARVPSPG